MSKRIQILKILRNIKLKIHNIKLFKKIKIKKVLKITYLVKKLAYILLVTKNIYVVFRKTYYILQYRNKIWLLPNLVLKTLFLFIVLIKQVKGVFKILIFFFPTIKNITTRILVIEDKYKKYLIGSITPIISNSMSFSKLYPSTYLNKVFMYTGVFILSTGIFLPQKAAALTPKEVNRILGISCEFYDRLTKNVDQYTTKQFIHRYGVDYTTQMISKQVGMGLTAKVFAILL